MTPETARLLQHWRRHEFTGVCPFLCQMEAVETVIWLTEVVPNERQGKGFLEHLANENNLHFPLDSFVREAWPRAGCARRMPAQGPARAR